MRKIFIFSISLLLFACKTSNWHKIQENNYQSDNLVVYPISPNTYVHISYLQTDDFGKVECNGLIVRDGDEVVIFDTPTEDESSEELITWVEQNLKCKIKAVIPTHFHKDCLGGINAFKKHGIQTYAHDMTIEYAIKENMPIPQNGFVDSMNFRVGSRSVSVTFLGGGHTRDNVIAYFPNENVMFGGCLVKEIGANEGYLGDADTIAWSQTVEKVKKRYPHVKIIVPGHGKIGDVNLLDYTIQLMNKYRQ